MYSKKEILCILRTNKEKVNAFYDPIKGEFDLKIKPNVKLKKIKKSKYIDSYRISDVEEKYLEILKLNPIALRLEFSEMDYFVLLSSIPINKVKLLDGMKYSSEKGFFDDTSTLNIYIKI